MRSDAARNRQRILDAARDVIAREGPAASMDAIADAAGVAVGTLYRHHPTKAALVEAVIGDSIDQLAAGIESANERVAAGADPVAELTAVFRAIADRYPVDAAVKSAAATLGAHVAHVDELADPSALTPGSTEERAWRAVQELLTAAQAQGRIRADLTPADLLALVEGIPGAGVPDEVRDRYVDIVLTGVRAAR